VDTASGFETVPGVSPLSIPRGRICWSCFASPGLLEFATSDREKGNCELFPDGLSVVVAQGLQGGGSNYRAFLMKFTIEVGETEKHKIEFSFNQLLGNLQIRVDDKSVFESTRIFNEPIHEVYNFSVGSNEKAVVRIEKKRKQLFGHRNCVFVDNRLTRVVEGF
jgi:hypothetical protein